MYVYEFYNKNAPEYLPFIKNDSESGYLNLIKKTKGIDFIKIFNEVLGEDVARHIILLYISRCEKTLLMYEKLFAPLKFVLRPFWHLYKRMFRK